LLIAATMAACANGGAGAPPGQLARASGFAENDSFGAPADRQIIRSADLALRVSGLDAARDDAEAAVQARSGYLESAYQTESSLTLRLRVPADQLDTLLADLKGLGTVERETVSARDVTEEHADLRVRLANKVELRERLIKLLDKATTVKELLTVEKELARVQTEVESLQGRLDRLNAQVAMSGVSLTLRPKRVLGPLGYVGYGLYWLGEKLFVIR
jgi:chromosome segregation ATPase